MSLPHPLIPRATNCSYGPDKAAAAAEPAEGASFRRVAAAAKAASMAVVYGFCELAEDGCVPVERVLYR